MTADGQPISGVSKKVEAIGSVITTLISVCTALATFRYDYLPRGVFAVGLTAVILFIFAGILALIIKYQRAKLVTAVLLPLTIAAAAAGLFLVPVWLVLHLSQFDPRGEAANSPAPDRLTMAAPEQSYGLRFDREAGYAEVHIRPDHPDRGRVETLTPVYFTAGTVEDKDKIRRLPKKADNEEQFGIKSPARSLNATVKFRARLAEGKAQFPISFLVSYSYWQETQFWRLKRWVFRQFGK